MTPALRSRRGLAELFESSGVAFDRARVPDFEVRSITVNSREAGEGSVFVAVRGAKADGNSFIGDAVRRGARVVVTDSDGADGGGAALVRVPNARAAYAALTHRFYGAPSDHMKTIGITGTNGKTTTAYLARAIAGRPAQTGLIGTIRYEFGSRVEESSHTTPDPARLHALFAEWREAGCELISMEVSSHALDQDRLAGMSFDAAVFTNLTQDHLDYHGTMEKYLEAKSRLFTMIRPGGAAVLNADDAAFGSLSKIAKRTLSYGVRAAADLRAESLETGLEGSSFTLSCGGRRAPVRTRLFGLHNVYNILGACGAALAIGEKLESLPPRIEAFEGVTGRLEAIEAGQAFKLFVDYAHTDDGLRNVLEAVRPYAKRELIVVFGCGGNRDRTKRPKMARVAESLADFVVLTSDNPRHEDPKAILKEVAAGFSQGFDRYETQPDRRKAIRRALLKARKGDVVVLAGKGHEEVQVVGDERQPFSDRLEALHVLSGK